MTELIRSPARPFAAQGGVVVLAHRGFSGLYPENTLLAFEKAAALPIDGLEMDIHATQDGVLVISHDDTVDRLTNGTGPIQSYTLAELQELDAGYTFTLDGGQTFPFRDQGLTIPTLDEVLARFPDLWINVDIKQHEPSVVDPFCRLIHRHNAAAQLCVGSFSNAVVEQFRAACPDVVTLATKAEIIKFFTLQKLYLDPLLPEMGRAMQIPPEEAHFGLTIDMFTTGLLETAHQLKLAIHLWTINEEEAMRHFIQVGVDGLITDFPDRALRVLGRLPARPVGEAPH